MVGLFAFPEGSSFEILQPLQQLKIGRNETENLSATTQYLPHENPHASGGYFRQVYGLPGAGAVAGEFGGVEGFYDLTIGYFDESDGVSWMELVVNGVVHARFDWDARYLDPIVTSRSLQEFTAWAVPLAPGDQVELRGVADGGEPLRTDYLEVAESSALPYGTTIRVEMEELLGGFYTGVEKNGAASGGATIRSIDGRDISTNYHVEHSGHYNITLGYFDETDGVSRLRISKNGEHLAIIFFDEDDGDIIASKGSARTFTLYDVEMSDQDRLEFYGTPDGGEPIRLDYVDLTFVEAGSGPPSPRLPDLWYEVDGEIKLSLNRGYGLFEMADAYGHDGISTGLDAMRGEYSAVDYDADGDSDFLNVWFEDPFPDPPEDGEGLTAELTLNATFFENNGAAKFTEATTSSVSFDVSWGDSYHWAAYLPEYVFDFSDAGDMDGDGDIDFFGFNGAAGTMLVFESQGGNTFEITEIEHPLGVDVDLTYARNYAFLADMDGNEFIDIVYSVGNTTNATHVLINDGAGGFTPVASMHGGDETNDRAVGDLDGDGDNDLALVGAGMGGEIFAFINDGTGASDQSLYPTYPPSYEITKGTVAVADFDGDGVDEILNAGLQDIYGGIMPGLRLFEFDVANNVLVEKSYDPNFFGHVVDAADFDGDGDVDFLGVDRAVFPSMQWQPVAAQLFLNDGSGSFDLSEENYVTGGFDDENYWYRPPSIGLGYFDDPYPIM